MLQPIDVEGDGCCLFHSVSRALFGVEVFNRVLRSLCVAELEAHKAWYVQHLYFGSEDTFLEDIGTIRAPVSEAPTTALVPLAHVLRRPVVLLSSLGAMSSGAEALGIGVNLPARLDPELCCPHPLLLAWGCRGHFVPLCRTTDSGQVLELPPQCRPAASFPLRTAELPGASVERYIPMHCWHLNTTRFSELAPKSLLFPQPADQPSALDALYSTLLNRCLTDAKALLSDITAEEAEMLLSPKFVEEAELAAEAKPAWLRLAALVEYEAGRAAHEVLTDQDMQTGVDGLCMDTWFDLKAGLSPQLVDSLTVAQLTQCDLALRSAAGKYLSKGAITQTSALEIADVAAGITVMREKLCDNIHRRKLAEVIAAIQASAEAMIAEADAVAVAQAEAAARAKAEADAKAAAKAREAEFDEALMNALVNSQHLQPRWAPSALARCAPITSHVSQQHDCISRAALPHIPTA